MRKTYSIIITLLISMGLSVAIPMPVRAQHSGHAPPASQPAEKHSTQEPVLQETPQIEISPEKQQLIGVKTTKVSVKPLQKVIRTVGRLEYDEKKLATINIKTEGWIEKLYVDSTGRYVRKGEPLAEIYSPDLLATQQEFLNVVKLAKQSESAKKDTYGQLIARDASAIVEAAKERLRLWDITEKQIKSIEETSKPVRTLTLYSPVSGYVIQKTALRGMKVMPGEKLYDVADLSTLWVIADIYEYELPFIKVGERARISLSYFPGRVFSSAIDYVYPTLSAETRTAKVRFVISNPDGTLKPQMYADVEIKIGMGKKLAVPEAAVINTGERQLVYVDKGEGYFEPREVATGLRADGMVEIQRGLKAGEKVASSANFLIDSEAQLKGVKPLQLKH